MAIDNEEIERLKKSVRFWEKACARAHQREKVLEDKLIECANWIEKVTKAL